MADLKGLAAYVERRGDRAAEVAWEASLALIVKAVDDAREGRFGRWRAYPRGELRRLRRDLAEGLELARLAVALQEEDREQTRELDGELRGLAGDAGRARRRAQTLPAERARLAKAAARSAGSAGAGEGRVA